jgi:16S rRNA C1402 N4-methylase RsmH
MTTMEYHNPVLLKESVDGLNIKPDGGMWDVTLVAEDILGRFCALGS